MRIRFHQDPVVVGELCRDLRDHGAVYWHTSRPNFSYVVKQIEAQGIDVDTSCARPGGDFMNFVVRLDLADELQAVEDAVAAAIIRWQHLGEPAGHVEPLAA